MKDLPAKIHDLRTLRAKTEAGFQASVEKQIDIVLDAFEELRKNTEKRLSALEQKPAAMPLLLVGGDASHA